MSPPDETPIAPPQGAAEPAPTVKGADTSAPAGIGTAPDDRPEVLVGAAFAGGLALGLLLRLLRRGDDGD